MPGTRRHLARACIMIIAVSSAVAAEQSSAQAYGISGCKLAGYTNTGIYHITYKNNMTTNATAGNAGIRGWNYTAAPIWFEASSSPKVVLTEANYGNTGWDGHTNRPCSYGVYTPPTTTQFNDTYMNGEPAGHKQEITVHELGHALGLEHVHSTSCSSMAIMEGSSTSTYWTCGFSTPRNDDIAGADRIYP